MTGYPAPTLTGVHDRRPKIVPFEIRDFPVAWQQGESRNESQLTGVQFGSHEKVKNPVKEEWVGVSNTVVGNQYYQYPIKTSFPVRNTLPMGPISPSVKADGYDRMSSHHVEKKNSVNWVNVLAIYGLMDLLWTVARVVYGLIKKDKKTEEAIRKFVEDPVTRLSK